MKKAILYVFCGVLLIGLMASDVMAKGGGWGRSSGRSSSIGPGTGSNYSSHSVRGYVRRDGTYVAPHYQSNPDGNINNNWSTKPNINPYTGEIGTRVDPGDRG